MALILQGLSELKELVQGDTVILKTQSQISPKRDLFFSLPPAASLLPLSWNSFSNILGSQLRVQLASEDHIC